MKLHEIRDRLHACNWAFEQSGNDRSPPCLRMPYIRTARGRPASRRIPPPPECLPRVSLRRSAVCEMDPKSQADWEALLLRERELAAALEALAQADDPEIRSTVREWWSVVSDVLEELRVRLARGHAMEPAPTDLFQTLQGTAGYLAVGVIPELVRDVAGPGKPAIGPLEAEHIAYAAAYIRLAERSLITDPAPVATVSRYFGVDRKTVQGWKQRELPRRVAAVADDPTRIKAAMEKAGAFYQAAQRRRYVKKRVPA